MESGLGIGLGADRYSGGGL